MPRLPDRRVNEEALVRVEAASVRFGDRFALRDVDFVLRPAEIVSLVGPNGAGKSTLVRLVLGVIAPDRGRVRRRPDLKAAYVPQRLQIDPTLPLTVGRFLNLPRRHPQAACEGALAETGVGGFQARPVQDLSGGEFQRVLLARALLQAPDLLVLDEPGAGVDAGGQADFFRLVGRVRREHGCAVLLVSHDLHLVMAATDRVVCLNRHVCCTGTPESVGGDPAYRALFGGSVAVYRHRHDHAHEPSGEVRGECDHVA